MKFSVITICYNEEKNITKTIESVLSQISVDFEYIICDGKSTDATVEIARSYITKFKSKGVDYKIYSEKDGGIYFAMNSGIDRANGDYVMFLNAGDRLYDSNVLTEMSEKIEGQSPEVVYGDCLRIDRCAGRVFKADHTNLKQGMSLAHPSTLVRSDVIKTNKFNTSYKIAADYNMFLDLYVMGVEFVHIDLIVSRFYSGGISTVQKVKTIKESCAIQKQHGLQIDEEQMIKNAERSEKKIKLKNKMPLFIWKFLQTKIKKRQWIED